VSRFPRRWRRWGSRLAGAVPVVLLLTVATAPLAFAEGVGQAPAALAWIDLKDSHGISMWNHELSLDRGDGFPFNPAKFFWASVTDYYWHGYRSYCAVALWFIDWVMSLDWLAAVASPLLEVGDAMQSVVNNLGLVPTFLMITALAAGAWMFRGRHATAVWEVAIACVIAVLATGVLAQPVQLVAGPDGYIINAHRLGQEIGAALATGDAAGKTSQELRRTQTGQLVDTFIRQPTQMINYGAVIDGGSCESVYNEVVGAGPYGSASTIRTKIAACDKTLGDYAANPSAGMATSALLFSPAAFVMLLFGGLLAGAVVAAGVWAAFQSVKAIWTMVAGLLPGSSRGSFFLTAAEVIVSLAIIVFTNVYLAVFLLIIQALCAASEPTSIARTFVIADVLIVVGLITFWKQRQRLKSMSHRLASLLAQRPGGSPTRLPEQQHTPNPVGAVIRTVANVGQLGAQVAANRRPIPSAGPTYVDNRQQAVFFGGLGSTAGGGAGGYAYQGATAQHQPVVVPGHVVDGAPPRPGLTGSSGTPALEPGQGPEPLPGSPTRPELPPGPNRPTGAGSGPASPAGGSSPRMSRAQRAKKVGGALVRAGTSAALAYATGGASTAVKAATKVGGAVRAARRTALAARLGAATVRKATGGGSVRPPRPAAPSTPAPGPVVTGRIIDAPSVPQPRPQRTAPTSPARPAPQRPASGTPAPQPRPPRPAPTSPARPAPAAGPQPSVRADTLRARLADRSRRRPPPTR